MKGKGMNARILATSAVAAALVAAMVVPWTPRVTAAAVERPLMVSAIKVSEPGTVVSSPGETASVERDAPLASLRSVEVSEKLGAARSRLEGLRTAMLGQGFDEERRASIGSSAEEAARAAAEVSVLEARLTALEIRAPFPGVVVDIPQERWGEAMLPRGESLGTLVSRERVIEAYVDEADLRRVSVGTAARFFPEDGGAPLGATVSRISAASARELESRELGSTHGGQIRVRPGREGVLIPETAVYRVMLSPDAAEDADPAARRRGVVSISAPPESLAVRAFRWAAGIAVREWGL